MILRDDAWADTRARLIAKGRLRSRRGSRAGMLAGVRGRLAAAVVDSEGRANDVLNRLRANERY